MLTASDPEILVRILSSKKSFQGSQIPRVLPAADPSSQR